MPKILSTIEDVVKYQRKGKRPLDLCSNKMIKDRIASTKKRILETTHLRDKNKDRNSSFMNTMLDRSIAYWQRKLDVLESELVKRNI